MSTLTLSQRPSINPSSLFFLGGYVSAMVLALAVLL